MTSMRHRTLKIDSMIETRFESVAPGNPDPQVISEAAEILRKGGLVAFPTETVYGLGADALNEEAVKKVFIAKGRPQENPLIVHIADRDQLIDLADEIPEKGLHLSKEFWPGPLTLVVRKTFLIPDVVTGGMDTVAIRMPDHPVALALIREFNGGIVGPSANLSGKPSPTTAMHVLEDLRGRIDMVLNAGPVEIGIESTVVDVTVDPPLILRPGGLHKESLEDIVGPVSLAATKEQRKRSPGSVHRHYAPRARVMLVPGGDSAVLGRLLAELRQQGKAVACIVHSREMARVETGSLFRVLPAPIDFYARYLFRTFRELDQEGVDVILVEEVAEQGLGMAVMDRLRKASEATNETS
ncbi:MAG: threonylcarbamoyl-AMP synthase [Bacteroidia bacterium]|nr:MAG: threonylcarbamoyl-AMP synthase [Bacteroidia bacterium]